LSGKICSSRRILENINNGINELSNIGMIDIVEIDKDHGFIINASKINIENTNDTKEYYIALNLEDVYKILNFDKIKSFKMLRYYTYLLTTFMQKTSVGFQTIKTMVESTNINDKSIMKYNTILQNLELIHVYKAKDILLDDGGDISGIANTYGRYKDKDKVISAGRNHESKYGNNHITKINKSVGNKTRSAAQKYNAFCNGKEYSEEELEGVYLTLIEFNNRQCYDDKKKDLSIFSKFKFYIKSNDSS
jgi:hypothetical protein